MLAQSPGHMNLEKHFSKTFNCGAIVTHAVPPSIVEPLQVLMEVIRWGVGRRARELREVRVTGMTVTLWTPVSLQSWENRGSHCILLKKNTAVRGGRN